MIFSKLGALHVNRACFGDDTRLKIPRERDYPSRIRHWIAALALLGCCAGFAPCLALAKNKDVSSEDLASYAVFQFLNVPAAEKGVTDYYNVAPMDIKDRKQFFANLRSREGPGHQVVLYFLVPTGKQTVILHYRRLAKHVIGPANSWEGRAKIEVDLKPGLYVVQGERTKDTATLWAVRHDTNEIVIPKTEIKPEVAASGEEFFPIVIPLHK